MIHFEAVFFFFTSLYLRSQSRWKSEWSLLCSACVSDLTDSFSHLYDKQNRWRNFSGQLWYNEVLNRGITNIFLTFGVYSSFFHWLMFYCAIYLSDLQENSNRVHLCLSKRDQRGLFSIYLFFSQAVSVWLIVLVGVISQQAEQNAFVRMWCSESLCACLV